MKNSSQGESGSAAGLGILLFLCAEAVLFTSLLGAFVIFRMSSPIAREFGAFPLSLVAVLLAPVAMSRFARAAILPVALGSVAGFIYGIIVSMRGFSTPATALNVLILSLLLLHVLTGVVWEAWARNAHRITPGAGFWVLPSGVTGVLLIASQL